VFGIVVGWVVTPLISGILTFFMLFFVQNVFGLAVTSSIPIQDAVESATAEDIGKAAKYINLILPGVIVLTSFTIVLLIFLIFRQQKLRLKSENDLLMQQNQFYSAQKTITEFEMDSIQREKEILQSGLEAKKKEFADAALNLTEQRTFLEKLLEETERAKVGASVTEKQKRLQEISLLIRQKMSFNDEKADMYNQVEQVHKDFLLKLETNYPQLTENEKRLATLIRLNLSTKEIATMLNISPKSVETARYRLKKTLGLTKDDNLFEYINKI
ncbi:MAG: hypothetical protein EOM23_11940, partial [Candidatus Moranbacteria bacterium]|nr:hypothetical protein [Candidatus Moranbacteria bacterium]